MAGFGPAGSMLAGGAVLFVVATAMVAFQGWPRIATQGSPEAIQISATATPPSRVSRRLRAVGRPTAARPAGASRAGVRPGAAPSPRPVGLRRPTAGVGRPSPGRAAHQNVSVSSATHPPATVSAPVGTVSHRVRTVVREVTGTAGHRVSGTGAQIGSAVGGRVGSTVTKVSATAGNALSQLGSGLGG